MSVDFTMNAVKYSPKVEIVPNPEALAARSVEIFLSCAQRAIRARDVFCVAISGGRTPGRFFQMLGNVTGLQKPEWEKVQLFWVDERYVPSDSPLSNYRLVQQMFLNKVTIPQKNIHRIETQYSDINQAAAAYQQSIRRAFSLGPGEIPQFDLIMLGLGADGHTASLFPGTDIGLKTSGLAAAVYVKNEKFGRITLTLPVLRAAGQLVVLVSGSEKAQILKAVLTSEPDENRYPVHTLWPVLDKVIWLVDKPAAQLLENIKE